MKDLDELYKELGHLLRNLRKKHNLSVREISDMLYLHTSTWKRYESCESAPDIPELVRIFNVLGESPMRCMLNYLYPDKFKDLSAESDIEKLREAIVHYMMFVASDHMVRELCFILFGVSGGSATAKLDEWTAVEHFPLKDRVVLANLVNTLYEVNKARDELVYTNHVMPDMENFKAGYLKGKEATFSGKTGYTTAIK